MEWGRIIDCVGLDPLGRHFGGRDRLPTLRVNKVLFSLTSQAGLTLWAHVASSEVSR